MGDRHLQNILLDLNDGSLVHIDFGYAFGTATAALPIPELVPFRATGAMLGGLAPGADAAEAVGGDMAAAMHALRRGAALLRGIMDVFLREPLVDWQREARQARVKAGRAGSTSGVNLGVDPDGQEVDEGEFVELKIVHAWGKLELANPAHVTLAQCAAKHEGQAHWEGLREIVLGTTPGPVKSRRAAAGETCGSVEEQVRCLLELATDPLVLATAWSGWRPWL